MSKKILINIAIKMRNNAFAPFSNYKVGAAVKTENGEIIGGCNVENSSYGLTCCAERVALFRAVAEGHTRFKALAVSTKNAGMPCGACRQVIWDLCGDIPIYICDTENIIYTKYISELIPQPFDKKQL